MPITVGEVIAPEPPLEQMARLLREKIEHLEPTDAHEVEWDELSEWDKDFYRFCVEDLMSRTKLVNACLIQLAYDSGINGGSDIGDKLHLNSDII